MDGRVGARANPSTSVVDVGREFLTPLHLEQFLYGLVLVETDGSVLYVNRMARQLLMPGKAAVPGAKWRCCDLICGRLGPLVGGGCISERIAQSPSHLPEVRMDIEHERIQTAAWVSASWWGSTNERLLFHLRPGKLGDRRRRAAPEWSGLVSTDEAKLQISTLGSFRVEATNGPLNGEWLEQRPGQLLKYLTCQRRRSISSDRIAEAMWPNARPEVARNRLRFYVHALREKLDPNRGRRSPCRFILAKRGGYFLDTSHVWIDADEFEREAQTGLGAFQRGLVAEATDHLALALDLYQASFLSEEPYADWALEERERLQDLACRALRARIEIASNHDDLDSLAAYARRLAEMEPFDADVQKMMIQICLRRGRRSEAFRRYSALRKRMLSYFDEEPGFDLTNLDEAEPSTLGLGAKLQ